MSGAAASHLVVSASPATITAGSTETIVITAEDQFGNLAKSFAERSPEDSLGSAASAA